MDSFTNSPKGANISDDRAGGTSQRCGNSPAIYFSEQFTPNMPAPDPLTPRELMPMLVERGFLDGASDRTEYVLNRISYQHFVPYMDLIKDEGGNIPPLSSFKKLHRLALFDRKLQTLFMEYIGIFELQFRAQYSYSLGKRCGAFAHRDARNFRNREFYERSIKKYINEANKKAHSKAWHVISDIELYGDLPVWNAVETMSFGTLSMLYKNTRCKQVKADVSDSFGLRYEMFESWVNAISAVRNECAHFGSICCKPLMSRPKRMYGMGFDDNTHFFYMVLVLARMLQTRQPFNDDTTLAYGLNFIRDALQLFLDFRNLLDLIGMPEGWLAVLTSEPVAGFDIAPEDGLNLDDGCQVEIGMRIQGGGAVIEIRDR